MQLGVSVNVADGDGLLVYLEADAEAVGDASMKVTDLSRWSFPMVSPLAVRGSPFTYIQSPSEVPEPPSLLLWLGGLLVFGGRLLHRGKSGLQD